MPRPETRGRQTAGVNPGAVGHLGKAHQGWPDDDLFLQLLAQSRGVAFWGTKHGPSGWDMRTESAQSLKRKTPVFPLAVLTWETVERGKAGERVGWRVGGWRELRSK